MKNRTLILAILLLSACGHTLSPVNGSLPMGGLQRLYHVTGSLYRSPQPNRAQFKALAHDLGIKTVIKLNYEIEGWELPPTGVKVAHLPINVLATVKPEYINQILNDIDKALAVGPVLIHCSHGEDRTGLIVGLWKFRHGLGTPKVIWDEMVAYGFHDGTVNTPGLPKLVEAFREFTSP